MQENDDEPIEKHPKDMTSDELLDYSVGPEVAERVKRLVKAQEEPADCESDD